MAQIKIKNIPDAHSRHHAPVPTNAAVHDPGVQTHTPAREASPPPVNICASETDGRRQQIARHNLGDG